jgi:hypothetical protein
MRGLRPVNPAWKVPTILTDASLQIELVRHLWLDMKLAGDIAVDRRATFPRAEDVRLISWTLELSANYGFSWRLILAPGGHGLHLFGDPSLLYVSRDGQRDGQRIVLATNCFLQTIASRSAYGRERYLPGWT